MLDKTESPAALAGARRARENQTSKTDDLENSRIGHGPQVVIERQSEVTVEVDEDGFVGIIEHSYDRNSVWIAPKHAPRLARAILDAAGLHDVEFIRASGTMSFTDFDPEEDFAAHAEPTRPDLDAKAAVQNFNSRLGGLIERQPSDSGVTGNGNVTVSRVTVT